METNKQHITRLLYKRLNDELTDVEEQQLQEWISAGGSSTDFLREVQDDGAMMQLLSRLHQDRKNGVREQLFERVQLLIAQDKEAIKPAGPVSAHRIHFLRSRFFRYAAAIIVLFGLGAYLWSTTNKTEHTLVTTNKPLPADIVPGGNKAILTLADGRMIALDSASNGALAQQGNAQIVKLANGQVAYHPKGVTAGENMLNTMSTPNGGQYQLVLPDGTKVWLNAASSITYPAAFVSSERKVKITGEVYLEVARDKEKPFIVDIDGKSLIQVLGTSFNINSYKDEENIKTTLVEGSIAVQSLPPVPRGKMEGQAADGAGTSSPASVILKPGQQAQINSEGITIKQDANLDQAIAWKNGIFNFNGADLKAIMRQLERWYDIKVQYKDTVSHKIFGGKIYRNINLSSVLKALQEMDVKFQLEGKTLTVL